MVSETQGYQATSGLLRLSYAPDAYSAGTGVRRGRPSFSHCPLSAAGQSLTKGE